MSIKKEYSKDKAICKATFVLPKEIAQQFDEVALVGDFNKWDPKENLFVVKETGEYSVSLQLEAGKEYQFRYLGNGNIWLNESDADKHVINPFGDSDNSVIIM